MKIAHIIQDSFMRKTEISLLLYAGFLLEILICEISFFKKDDLCNFSSFIRLTWDFIKINIRLRKE